jgi:hypothetical protein
MAEPVVLYLSAVSALFLSAIVLSAIARQRTMRTFQKRVLLFSVLLLVAAIVSNVMINVSLQNAAPTDPEASNAALVLSKRVQATFDHFFGIAIGAFVVAIAVPTIRSLRDFFNHLRDEFPSSYLFYVFVLAVSSVSVWMADVQVMESGDRVTFYFPPWFLFTLALAWLTIIVYVPFVLLSYLRRIRATPDTRRDVLLIMLGIIGYTIVEFLVEVALPSQGIDIRSPGFVLEIALVGLVAYGVREREFLEGLLKPVAEADLETEMTYDLDSGFSYIVLEDNPHHSFAIFKDLVTHGVQGLCITRKPPKVVMEKYGLERTPILWLSRVANHKNCVRPSPPENVAMAVEHFLGASEDSAVLLDGLEYLISHNDFSTVLALLHDMNETVSLKGGVLLIPLDPKTLREREFRLIRRDLRTIKAPEGVGAA